MRGRRGAVQGVRVGEAFGLGVQIDVLAVGWFDPLDLGQAVPQILGLPRALPRLRGQLVEFGPHLEVPLIHPLVVAEQVGEFGPGEPVERGPLPARLEQLLLVGLAVHGHKVVGQVREQGHRYRATAGEGARPALGGHRPLQHQRAAVVVQVAA